MFEAGNLKCEWRCPSYSLASSHLPAQIPSTRPSPSAVIRNEKDPKARREGAPPPTAAACGCCCGCAGRHVLGARQRRPPARDPPLHRPPNQPPPRRPRLQALVPPRLRSCLPPPIPRSPPTSHPRRLRPHIGPAASEILPDPPAPGARRRGMPCRLLLRRLYGFHHRVRPCSRGGRLLVTIFDRERGGKCTNLLCSLISPTANAIVQPPLLRPPVQLLSPDLTTYNCKFLPDGGDGQSYLSVFVGFSKQETTVYLYCRT